MAAVEVSENKAVTITPHHGGGNVTQPASGEDIIAIKLALKDGDLATDKLKVFDITDENADPDGDYNFIVTALRLDPANQRISIQGYTSLNIIKQMYGALGGTEATKPSMRYFKLSSANEKQTLDKDGNAIAFFALNGDLELGLKDTLDHFKGQLARNLPDHQKTEKELQSTFSGLIELDSFWHGDSDSQAVKDLWAAGNPDLKFVLKPNPSAA